MGFVYLQVHVLHITSLKLFTVYITSIKLLDTGCHAMLWWTTIVPKPQTLFPNLTCYGPLFVVLTICTESWARGAMDNASDYGSEDSRFESWRARQFSIWVFISNCALEIDCQSWTEAIQCHSWANDWSTLIRATGDRTVHIKLPVENPGIDPGTSHMLSERSTTWANSPSQEYVDYNWPYVAGTPWAWFQQFCHSSPKHRLPVQTITTHANKQH